MYEQTQPIRATGHGQQVLYEYEYCTVARYFAVVCSYYMCLLAGDSTVSLQDYAPLGVARPAYGLRGLRPGYGIDVPWVRPRPYPGCGRGVEIVEVRSLG